MKAKVVAIRPIKRIRPRVIALTGTPVSESPLNAYSILRLLAPELITSKAKFTSVFVDHQEIYIKGRKIEKVAGYKNLDKLRDLLSTISIRRTLDQVEGMPAKIWVERPVRLAKDEVKVYKALVQQATSGLYNKRGTDISEEDISTITLRLRQFINDPAIIGSDLNGAKLLELDAIVEEVLEDPKAKMIVWTNYIDPLPRLVKRYAQYKAIAVSAETKPDVIEKLGKTFDTNDCRMVILTPQKGGTGLDFLNRARTAVYVDLPYSFVLFKQSQDRIVRRTNAISDNWLEKLKGTPAVLIRLHAQNTVDDLVFEMLKRKEEVATAATKVDLDELKLKTEEIIELLGKLD